jgi:hypothetical protein
MFNTIYFISSSASLSLYSLQAYRFPASSCFCCPPPYMPMNLLCSYWLFCKCLTLFMSLSSFRRTIFVIRFWFLIDKYVLLVTSQMRLFSHITIATYSALFLRIGDILSIFYILIITVLALI